MKNIFRLLFAMLTAMMCGGVALIAAIENYLQLVAALSLLNTDDMPISADRGMAWLATIIPAEASLVEGMSLLMSLGFAIGVFFTTRLLFELPAYVMAVRQTSDPHARRTLLGTLLQKTAIALALGTLLGLTAHFEYELFTLRAIANALGEDSASDAVLNLVPWSQGHAEYAQSYALSLSRQLPQAYLGVVVIAAALFELSIADLGDKWDQCIGSFDEADDLEEIDGIVGAAAATGVDDAVPPTSTRGTVGSDGQTSGGTANDSDWTSETAQSPRDGSEASAAAEHRAREIRFTAPSDAKPAASSVRSNDQEAGGLVDIIGRPGQRITLEQARKDPALRIDVATRRVWDRAFEEQLLQQV